MPDAESEVSTQPILEEKIIRLDPGKMIFDSGLAPGILTVAGLGPFESSPESFTPPDDFSITSSALPLDFENRNKIEVGHQPGTPFSTFVFRQSEDTFVLVPVADSYSLQESFAVLKKTDRGFQPVGFGETLEELNAGLSQAGVSWKLSVSEQGKQNKEQLEVERVERARIPGQALRVIGDIPPRGNLPGLFTDPARGIIKLERGKFLGSGVTIAAYEVFGTDDKEEAFTAVIRIPHERNPEDMKRYAAAELEVMHYYDGQAGAQAESLAVNPAGYGDYHPAYRRLEPDALPSDWKEKLSLPDDFAGSLDLFEPITRERGYTRLSSVIGGLTSLEAPNERRKVLLTALQMHHLAFVCRKAGIEAFYDRKGGDFFESEEGRLTVMDWGVTIGYPSLCEAVAVLKETGALAEVDNLEADRVFPDDYAASFYLTEFLAGRMINSASPNSLLGLSSLAQDVQDRLSKWPLSIKLPLLAYIDDSLDHNAFKDSSARELVCFFRDSARAVNYYGQLLWMRKAEPPLVFSAVHALQGNDPAIPWNLLAAEAMTERGFTKAAQQLSGRAENWEERVKFGLDALFQIGVRTREKKIIADHHNIDTRCNEYLNGWLNSETDSAVSSGVSHLDAALTSLNSANYSLATAIAREGLRSTGETGPVRDCLEMVEFTVELAQTILYQNRLTISVKNTILPDLININEKIILGECSPADIEYLESLIARITAEAVTISADYKYAELPLKQEEGKIQKERQFFSWEEYDISGKDLQEKGGKLLAGLRDRSRSSRFAENFRTYLGKVKDDPDVSETSQLVVNSLAHLGQADYRTALAAVWAAIEKKGYSSLPVKVRNLRHDVRVFAQILPFVPADRQEETALHLFDIACKFWLDEAGEADRLYLEQLAGQLGWGMPDRVDLLKPQEEVVFRYHTGRERREVAVTADNLTGRVMDRVILDEVKRDLTGIIRFLTPPVPPEEIAEPPEAPPLIEAPVVSGAAETKPVSPGEVLTPIPEKTVLADEVLVAPAASLAVPSVEPPVVSEVSMAPAIRLPDAMEAEVVAQPSEAESPASSQTGLPVIDFTQGENICRPAAGLVVVKGRIPPDLFRREQPAAVNMYSQTVPGTIPPGVTVFFQNNIIGGKASYKVRIGDGAAMVVNDSELYNRIKTERTNSLFLAYGLPVLETDIKALPEAPGIHKIDYFLTVYNAEKDGRKRRFAILKSDTADRETEGIFVYELCTIKTSSGERPAFVGRDGGVAGDAAFFDRLKETIGLAEDELDKLMELV